MIWVQLKREGNRGYVRMVAGPRNQPLQSLAEPLTSNLAPLDTRITRFLPTSLVSDFVSRSLRHIGFQANRRLLQVQRISHDCILAEEAFQNINRPIRASGRRSAPPLSALLIPKCKLSGAPSCCSNYFPQAFPTATSANTSLLCSGNHPKPYPHDK